MAADYRTTEHRVLAYGVVRRGYPEQRHSSGKVEGVPSFANCVLLSLSFVACISLHLFGPRSVICHYKVSFQCLPSLRLSSEFLDPRAFDISCIAPFSPIFSPDTSCFDGLNSKIWQPTQKSRFYIKTVMRIVRYKFLFSAGIYGAVRYLDIYY